MRDGAKKLPPLNLGETTRFPRVIELQTTTVCNARCVTCPYESVYGDGPGTRMADGLLWKILYECREHRDEISQMVPYHNNEPLTDKRMSEVLRFIGTEIGVPVELSTNATLITSETKALELLRHLAGGTLRISFFGATPVSYEARMKRLSWQTARKNIERLLDVRARVCPSLNVEIIMIATAGLSPVEVAAAREMWEPMGAQVVVFGYLDRAGNMGTSNVLPRVRKTSRMIGCDLNRPFERINIDARGRAILCSQDWRGEVVLGDVNTSSIANVWNSSEYANIRAQVSGKTMATADLLCRTCKIAMFE